MSVTLTETNGLYKLSLLNLWRREGNLKYNKTLDMETHVFEF